MANFLAEGSPMSDEVPSRNFGTPSVETAPSSRRRLVAITAIAGALLVAVVVLLVILMTRGTSDPVSAPGLSTSPTPGPISSPSDAPLASSAPLANPPPLPSSPPGDAPQALTPSFSSFSAPAEESGCSMGGPTFAPTAPGVKVSWATTGAVEVWFVVGNSDAADSRFMQLPLAGTQDDFPYPGDFGCSRDSVDYTLTLVGAGGEHVHKRWTVINTGDKF